VPKPDAKKADTSANCLRVPKPRGWEQSVEDANALIRKAEAGDKDSLAILRKVLAQPGNADILGGNVARVALQKLVETATGGNPVIQEATERKFDEMRAELLGPSPTALERLLVERIIATWYHLHYLEAQYARKTEMTFALGSYYEKCLSAAQKRYLAAIKGLSEVRKLALPALQVNIAKKQINVAAGNSG
jgi:hypothetical protein